MRVARASPRPLSRTRSHGLSAPEQGNPGGRLHQPRRVQARQRPICFTTRYTGSLHVPWERGHSARRRGSAIFRRRVGASTCQATHTLGARAFRPQTGARALDAGAPGVSWLGSGRVEAGRTQRAATAPDGEPVARMSSAVESGSGKARNLPLHNQHGYRISPLQLQRCPLGCEPSCDVRPAHRRATMAQRL